MTDRGANLIAPALNICDTCGQKYAPTLANGAKHPDCPGPGSCDRCGARGGPVGGACDRYGCGGPISPAFERLTIPAAAPGATP